MSDGILKILLPETACRVRSTTTSHSQSPWAYIGHKSFRDVVGSYDLKVNHKPVVLVDLFSETGGLPLLKRHPVRQRYRMVELQRWRDKRGLQFHLSRPIGRSMRDWPTAL